MTKKKETNIEAAAAPVEAPKPVEKVLVFPAELLGDFRGVSTDHDTARSLMESILHSGELSFMDRPEAETNENFKQLIPYIVVVKGRQVLRYRRTKKSGEQRLAGKWSVGIGGHINPEDCEHPNRNDLYTVGMIRELHEEINLGDGQRHTRPVPPVIGCIYDDSNEVGRVHFGVVHFLHITPTDHLAFNDPAVQDAEFRTFLDIRRSQDEFENWSRLVIDNMIV